MGCTDAVTFRFSNQRKAGYSPDDGLEIARHLGLDVTSYERHDVRARPDFDPTEMFVNVFRTTESHNRVMAEQTAGTLWFNGRHGEQFWGMDPVGCHPWLRDPASTSASGRNYSEARLRIGYIAFALPYTLGVYAPALNRISRSRAMAPWSVGGDYDRPIARRILETRGVPRESFGQRKMGGGDRAPEFRELPDRWQKDFLSFYAQRVPARVRARLLDEQRGAVPYYVSSKMGRVERWCRAQPLLGGLTDRVLGDRTHHLWRSRYLYTFHWGLEHLRQRYATRDSVAARADDRRADDRSAADTGGTPGAE